MRAEGSRAGGGAGRRWRRGTGEARGLRSPATAVLLLAGFLLAVPAQAQADPTDPVNYTPLGSATANSTTGVDEVGQFPILICGLQVHDDSDQCQEAAVILGAFTVPEESQVKLAAIVADRAFDHFAFHGPVDVAGGPGSGDGQLRAPHDVGAVSFRGPVIDPTDPTRGIRISLGIADTGNDRVLVWWDDMWEMWRTGMPAPGQRWTLAFGGYDPHEVRFPRGTAHSLFGTAVANTGDDRVQFWDRAGTFLGYQRAFGNRAFNHPMGIDLDDRGNVAIADTGNNRVVGLMQPLGSSVRLPFSVEIDRLHHPTDVAMGRAGSGSLYIANRDEVLKIRLMRGSTGPRARTSQNAQLVLESVLGERGTGPGQFRAPQGIAKGDRGFLYVADTGNNRIQVFQNARCRRALVVRDRMASLFPRARRVMAAAVRSYRAALRRGERRSASRAARQYFRARRVAAGAARRYFAAGRVVRSEC